MNRLYLKLRKFTQNHFFLSVWFNNTSKCAYPSDQNEDCENNEQCAGEMICHNSTCSCTNPA